MALISLTFRSKNKGTMPVEKKRGPEMNRRFGIHLLLLFVAALILIFSGNALAAAKRGNAVPKNMLPAELKNAAVYDYFLESGEKGVATIAAKDGKVIVAKADLKQAYFAAAGDKLFEKDVIFTLKKSRCKFQLVTEDLVSLGPQSRLIIKEVVDDRDNQSKSSSFGMAKGTAIFHTVSVSRYFKQSMEAESPTAVSGVRGSKFGMEVKPAKGKSSAAMPPVMVADASGNGFLYLAYAKKEQDDSVTVVHGFEGKVEVKSKKDDSIQFLNPGQSIEATIKGLSKIFDTPAKAIEQFMNNVDINLQKAAKEAEKSVKVVDKNVKDTEKKMEKHFDVFDKWGKDLEKKWK
jgi:hypothetical protein